MHLTRLARSAVAGAARWRLSSFALNQTERLVGERENVFAVLMYHRVAGSPAEVGSPPGLLSTTPEQFEEQMAMVARRYRPIGLDELARRVRSGTGTLPRRSLLVTFDDAYHDFADRAWPVLARWGIPATLFVPTSFPGSVARMFWWDRLYRLVTRDPLARIEFGTDAFRLATDAERDLAYRRLHAQLSRMAPEALSAALDNLEAQVPSLPPPRGSTLDWDELRHLAAAGVSLAPHSRTHPRLDLLRGQELEDEVAGSLADLRAEVPGSLPAFAYPGGYVSPSVTLAVRNAGYDVAFTTHRGVNDVRSMDPLLINRLNVGRLSGPTLIRAQLLPLGR